MILAALAGDEAVSVHSAAAVSIEAEGVLKVFEIQRRHGFTDIRKPISLPLGSSSPKVIGRRASEPSGAIVAAFGAIPRGRARRGAANHALAGDLGITQRRAFDVGDADGEVDLAVRALG